MYLGEINGNLSKKKQLFSFPTLSQNKKMRRFLIMNNFYLAETLNEPNSLTIVTSKKILKMSNYVKIEQLWIFFS